MNMPETHLAKQHLGGAARQRDDQPPVVGLIQANRETTDDSFRVLLLDGQYLAYGDLVYTTTQVPGLEEPDETYGVVVGTSSVSEGAEWANDTLDIGEGGAVPTEQARLANVQIIRHIPDDLWIAPNPGQQVHRAEGPHRDRAVYMDNMATHAPMGFHRDRKSLPLDVDFLNGNKGAHVNISGMSGVATKTTYALFLLRSLMCSLPNTGFMNQMRVLVFNVKGEDLLWLDLPNKHLTDQHRKNWDDLYGAGKWGAFPQVAYWAPPNPQVSTMPHTGSRMDKAKVFAWTPAEFCEEGMLGFLLSARDTESNTNIAHLSEHITTKLQREAAPQLDGSVNVGKANIRTLEGITDFLSSELEDPERETTKWMPRSTHLGTIGAFMRRLRGITAQLDGLVRVGGDRIDPYGSQVTVVDLHRLSATPQRFVVGTILNQIHRDKDRGSFTGTLMVVLDELNEYAPRKGNSPIKETLIDIAQRGRSLGVILVGCQQSASRTAPEIVENAAIRAVGRLDSAEVAKPEYAWLGDRLRRRATLIGPGQMIVSQPSVPHPMLIRFPFPCWATRESEADKPPVMSTILGA